MATIDTGTEELLCEIQERVATVTLKHLHKKNSLSNELTRSGLRTDPRLLSVAWSGTSIGVRSRDSEKRKPTFKFR